MKIENGTDNNGKGKAAKGKEENGGMLCHYCCKKNIFL